MTYAFDLDGTLCSLTDGDYTLAQPLLDRIKHVNHLHDQGNTILIFTARGSTSKRNFEDVTLEQLEAWGVKYDELIMGKPHYDILVDDKAMNESAYFYRLGK